jgi:hypothetical protein
MYAFLSYQTNDKAVAGKVQQLLETLAIPSFLAHENIEVSAEWRVELLKKIRETNIFIPILSTSYYRSVWCTQESGIAAFNNMTFIPLSTDGSTPEGFFSQFQSTRINPEAPAITDLLPGLAKHDVSLLIDKIIIIIRWSSNYRKAEENFALILPYLPKAKDIQIVELLKVSTSNEQVCNAGLCARNYLPPLVKSHGHLMATEDRKKLADTLKRNQ